MQSTSQIRFKTAKLSLCALAVLTISVPALSAQASTSFSKTVSVTVEKPTIETRQDRIDAIKAFRKDAVRACANYAVKGLEARKIERECAENLVHIFASKLDSSQIATYMSGFKALKS